MTFWYNILLWLFGQHWSAAVELKKIILTKINFLKYVNVEFNLIMEFDIYLTFQ